jgi:hypothetical protein
MLSFDIYPLHVHSRVQYPAIELTCVVSLLIQYLKRTLRGVRTGILVKNLKFLFHLICGLQYVKNVIVIFAGLKSHFKCFILTLICYMST